MDYIWLLCLLDTSLKLKKGHGPFFEKVSPKLFGLVLFVVKFSMNLCLLQFITSKFKDLMDKFT